MTPIRRTSDATCLVQQADGKLVVAGYSSDHRHPQAFTLVRYHPNGTLDRSFGRGSGIVIASGGQANALVQQTDGKLVAAGTREIGPQHQFAFGITRYDTDGMLDRSFGGGTGTVTTVFGSNGPEANALVQQSDGKLVVAGDSGGGAFTLMRYDADGTLDASFGEGTGRVTGPSGAASALVQQADGKLVAAGRGFGVTGQTLFMLVRYDADGTLDPSFGEGTGTVITPFITGFANSSGLASALVQQPDGKLVAAGISSIDDFYTNSFAIVRYNADGTLDPTFGAGTGIVITPVRGTASAHALVLQPDGKIVAAGSSDTPQSTVPSDLIFNPSRPKFTLVRYNVDGTLDTSFGRLGAGVVTGPSGAAFGLVQQADGKLVAAGSMYLHNSHVFTGNVFTVVRYLD
jgi:uncharacterized delta-60 repeat protein